MAFDASTAPPIRRAAIVLRPRGRTILAAAAFFAAAGILSQNALMQLTFLTVSATLAFIAAWVWYVLHETDAANRRAMAEAARMTAADTVPRVLTGPNRLILYSNPAAKAAFASHTETTLAGALSDTLENAGPVLFQLESEAGLNGAATRTVALEDRRLRISVHRVGEQPEDRFLWRVETLEPAPETGRNSLPVPALSLGQDGTVLSLNAAARTLLRDDAETLGDIFPGRPPREGQLNDVRGREGTVACFVVARAGADGRRELFLVPGADGPAHRPEGWTFFDDLPVPLLKLSRGGVVQLSNRPARALLGVESCAGRRLGEVMEGLGRPIADWLDDTAAGRGTVHSETLRVRREDKEVFVQVSLNTAREAGEAVLIAVLSDATRFKSLEEQFVQSQKMQAIGQLAGGVAHDFNNLLTAISGHCDLLLLRHDQGDPDYADLVQISQNANRAAALVSQLLAYSRKQTLRPEIMDLRDMLADLTHLLNRLVGERVTLNTTHGIDLWQVRADKRQLEQVLMNLVVNARDAMPEGGEIAIETANLRLDAPLKRDRATVAPGRYVSLTVRDEGAGIPPDKLQKVFEPFFTTKRPGEGTGLGLSTAYGIIKQTGGFIFAASTPGEGTEFLLLLPAFDAVAEKPARPARLKGPDAPAGGVVLLVEDEAPVRAFASRALKMRGFCVLEAASAEEALALLEDETLTVDVFVTDVVMPGIDGPTWVRQALERRPETRVVFVSGYAAETFGDAQAEIAGSVFLPKPFSLTELTETVRTQIAG